MNGFGDQFLSGAAFALDQYRDMSGGDLPDNFEHLLHGRRIADDILDAELFVDLLL